MVLLLAFPVPVPVVVDELGFFSSLEGTERDLSRLMSKGKLKISWAGNLVGRLPVTVPTAV